ncbi:MAG: HNH endonuclease signature motif containing protein, partial [Actinomycetota bacterium]
QVGADVQARLDAEVDRRFKQAGTDGDREPKERYKADALAALILGNRADDTTAAAGEAETANAAPDQADPSPADSSADDGDRPVTVVHKHLHLDIDLAAYRRRETVSGETCNIRGIGPVPVEVALQWAGDAFMTAVIRDGTDIKRVAHLGRHVPAQVRTAIETLDQTCAVPGCTNDRTELDHELPHADDGACSVDNLRPLCVPHHRQRTHDGYELRGPPGDRAWHAPDGRVLFADDPDRPRAEPALI